MMGTSALIPAFRADSTEEGLEGTYLSSIEDVEAFDFPLYSQLQSALLHNCTYNNQWKRHFKADYEPVPTATAVATAAAAAKGKNQVHEVGGRAGPGVQPIAIVLGKSVCYNE
eukprot:1053170-Pelagomonas_calceolata.AAC.3